MKTKLLLMSFLFTSAMAISQVVANQIDDFEDGTTRNWIIGNPGSAMYPPVNVSTGGPAGVDDNFLEYTSTGGSGAGSKMVIFSSNEQWSQNFTTQSVIAIKFDASVLTNDLNLRIGFQGPAGTKICTTNAVAVTAGSGWNSVTISISETDFTIVEVGGGTSIADVLASVFSMRILSSSTPTWASPDIITATLRVDNITASTTLGVDEVANANDFSISPNPASSQLNVRLPYAYENAKIEVYDVLGKKIFSKELNALASSFDVSKWNSGMYLVRVSTESSTHTKRFVKQ